jgi:uncharacterized membrane protein
MRGASVHFFDTQGKEGHTFCIDFLISEGIMEKLDTRRLQHRGAELAGMHRRECRRLVLVYSGVLAAIALGSNGLNLLLDSQMGSTGGLGGLGLRSWLQTGQEFLSLVNLFFGPFWSAGFLLAMLHMVRGEAPTPGHLTGGFRRPGRMLGFMAFEFLTVIMLLMSATYLAGMIFAFSPLGSRFTELMGSVMNDPNLISPDGVVNVELIPVEALEMAALPMTVLLAVIFLPAYIWMCYGFRMALYLLMDTPVGGVRAHFDSLRLMRGRKWQLFKLDLRFWWYYALELLVVVISYGHMILDIAGIDIGIGGDTAMFVFYLLSLAGQLGLYVWKKNTVFTTYALAYDCLIQPPAAKAEN